MPRIALIATIRQLRTAASNMATLTIQISWEYALGIIGSIIAGSASIAWYASGRLTALETSMEWVKSTLIELKVSFDNANAPRPAFGGNSPVDLEPAGIKWLNESGLKSYIDANKYRLLTHYPARRTTNPYEVQKRAFALFDALSFPRGLDERLKRFAFENGTTMSVLRRVGAIYFRNLYFERFIHHKSP